MLLGANYSTGAVFNATPDSVETVGPIPFWDIFVAIKCVSEQGQIKIVYVYTLNRCITDNEES